MVKWIYINSSKITRIGYNAEIKMMYIDFVGSVVDTPYKSVSEDLFNEFSKAKNVDGYFETQIKDFFEEVTFDLNNRVNISPNL